MLTPLHALVTVYMPSLSDMRLYWIQIVFSFQLRFCSIVEGWSFLGQYRDLTLYFYTETEWHWINEVH